MIGKVSFKIKELEHVLIEKGGAAFSGHAPGKSFFPDKAITEGILRILGVLRRGYTEYSLQKVFDMVIRTSRRKDRRLFRPSWKEPYQPHACHDRSASVVLPCQYAFKTAARDGVGWAMLNFASCLLSGYCLTIYETPALEGVFKRNQKSSHGPAEIWIEGA